MNNKRKSNFRLDYWKVSFWCASVYFVVLFCNQQVKLNEYTAQKEIYNKRIEEEKKNLAEYNKQQQAENTDELMEKYARDLGYIKPGEKIYIDINK